MVDSVTMSRSHQSRADCNTLLEAQFSALNTVAERTISDETKVSVCTTSGEASEG